MNNTITVIRGDDISLSVTFKDENDTPIDITGYTIFFTVKKNLDGDDDSGALIAKTVTDHTSPTTGVTTISLSSNDTDLPEDNYYYDFQTKDSSGNISSTKKGYFVVELDVTKRTS